MKAETGMADRRRPLRHLFVIVGIATSHPGLAAEPPDLASLQATRERPLFSPTRRPPPQAATEPPAAAPVATAPPPIIKVRGIIVGADRRVAIVTLGQNGPARPVSVGSDVDGWTVSAIDVRRIELRHESRSLIVVLPEAGR